jgi:phage gp29-like protein
MPETDATGIPLLAEIAVDRGEDVGFYFVDQIRLSRDEVLNEHGGGDLRFYERLTRDDQVFPAFTQRRLSVISRETKVDPGGPSELDKLAADHLRDQLKRISWDRTSMRMLAGIMYGFSVGECMFRFDGRYVLLDAIKVRRARRFRFGIDGTLRLIPYGLITPIVMPPRKFWVTTWGADDDDDPYGRGLGHYLYWPVWFKRNAIRFWSIYLETFAMPTPKAEVPAGATEAERRKVMAILDDVRAGGKLIVPKGVAVDFVQAMKDSGGDYNAFCDRMDGAIAKVVNTQTMTMDDGASLSQGQVHERKGNAVGKSDSDILTESFSAGPGKWLTEWNFPGAKPPIVYRDFADSEDLGARATRDNALNQMGYRPTPEYVRDTYGDGYQYVGPGAGAPDTNSQSAAVDIAGAPVAADAVAPQIPAATFAEPPRDASDAVEDLVAGDGWREVLGPQVDQVEKLIAECTSLEEVRNRLGELAIESPHQLADALSRVMFAARVAGNAGAESTPDDKGGQQP